MGVMISSTPNLASTSKAGIVKPRNNLTILPDGTLDVVGTPTSDGNINTNLNADMLDGKHASDFILSVGNQTLVGGLTVNSPLIVNPQDGSNEGGEIKLKTTGSFVGDGVVDKYQDNIRLFVTGGNILSVPKTSDVNINGYKVWHAGNNGVGSGLDADMVDGINFRINAGMLEFFDGTGWKGVGIKNVQRGVSAVGASNTVNITISAVNLSKSYICVNGTINGGSGPLANLTSPSNIQVSNSNVGYPLSVGWEVIEFA